MPRRHPRTGPALAVTHCVACYRPLVLTQRGEMACTYSGCLRYDDTPARRQAVRSGL